MGDNTKICQQYIDNAIRSMSPQSDYDKALSELDKEFSGATIEPIAPSIEIEKAPPSLFPVMLVFALGAISLFAFAVF